MKNDNNARETRFTLQQQSVINSRGKNLLVSASAGTGKTTVMIERIVSLIEEKTLSVSEIAVVTFTAFAASEMKQRLVAALSKRGKDDYFKKQCELVESAAISTIHSFCADILRNYFYVADVDPSFSIADGSAQLAYADKVMTDVFTDWGKKNDENYIKLYRVINSRRGDGNLREELRRLYEFSCCLPHFDQWYKESRKNYSFEEGSGYIAYLDGQYTEQMNYFADEIEKASYKAFETGANALADFLSYFSSCFKVSKSAPFKVKMKNLAEEEKIEAFTQSLKKYDASFKVDEGGFEQFIWQCKDLLESARACRNDWKKLSDLDELIKKAQSGLPLLDVLKELLDDFSKRYYEYKKERGLLDFSDLEHLTLKVLENAEAAAEIRGRYKALFVDEYQDVNGVQEEIIKKLCGEGEDGGQDSCGADGKAANYGLTGESGQELRENTENARGQSAAECDGNPSVKDENAAKERKNDQSAQAQNNESGTNAELNDEKEANCAAAEGGIKPRCQLFCVGDVKQSIYGFRQCDPSIFVRRQNDYKNKGLGEVIELSQNFRSDDRILKCVNSLFNYCMSGNFGQVDYAQTPPLESKKLLFSADHPVKVFSYDKLKEEKEVKGFYDIEKEANLFFQSEEEGEEQDESESAGREEAFAAVQCVKELVGTVKEFEEEGKTVRRAVNYSDITILSRDMKEGARSIYRLLLANNIPVTASFQDEYSSKEIADLINFLRVLDNPYCDIYFCGACLSPLFNFSAEELAEIAVDFSSCWRQRFTDYLAQGCGKYYVKIQQTLSFIEKFRALSMFFTVDALLSLLIEQKNYELYVLSMPNGGLRLSRLSAFLEELKDKPHAQSISKFLQYFDGRALAAKSGGAEQKEGVFLTTIHKSKGLEFPIVISAGLGANFKTDKNKVHFNKELGLALDYYDFDNMEKEESLSVIAQKAANKKKQAEEELRLLYVLTTRAINSLTLLVPGGQKTPPPNQARSISQWIAMTDGLGRGITPLEIKKEKDYAPTLPPQDARGEELEENLKFVYPFAKEQETPLKVTASGLREEVLKGRGEEENAEEETSGKEIEIKELFKEPVEAAPLGTAYHKVFEKLSLKASRRQVENTVEQLMQSGEIPRQNADALDLTKIENCLSNAKLLEITRGGKLYHEIPFMVKLPFDSLVEGASGVETVLQGVIDMLCVKDETAVIIDFKYTLAPHLIKKHYSLQMKAYKEAAKRILGKNVKSYIVSVMNDEVIEID